MHNRLLKRFLNCCSDNQKSKIENRKLVGIVALVVTLAMCGVVAQAQQPTRIPRIGCLNATSPSTMSARIEAFRHGLRELGYVEGKNIVIEYRYADEKQLARELVGLKVDVIVTGGPTSTRAAKEATNTIPIIMMNEGDPVASRFVANLARPGGNITGLSVLFPR